jgi:serine protease AprX
VNGLTLLGVEWDGNSKAARPLDRVRPVRAFALVLAASLLLASLAGAPRAPRLQFRGPEVAVIVRAQSARVSAVERLVARLGGSVGRRLAIIDGFTARVPASGLGRLAGADGVRGVTADAHGRMLSVDPTLGYDQTADLGSPTNLASTINATPAYAAGLTGKGVDVALIDSGVAPVDGLTAPGKVINGPDLSFDSQAPNLTYLDGYGHGTHMAGLIAGRDTAAGTVPDASHFTGVAPDARILNVKVGAADGSVDVSQVIAAIDWVVQHRGDNGLNVRVLNLSFGTDSPQPYVLDPLAYAAEVAWRKGIVVVVAGGNDGRTATSLADPAIDPFVLAVGADDPRGTPNPRDDAPASFSSRGTDERHVDLLAPGKSVLSLRDPNSVIDTNFPSARVGDRFFRGSGTSQAAAVTSGVAALLLQQRPNLSPDRLKALLMKSAVEIDARPKLAGAGVINVGRAMVTAVGPSTQLYPYSLGTGTLEGARGSAHVVDPLTGQSLSGERDIFGQAWNGVTWAPAALAGSSWSGGVWNGSSWSGSSWSGSSWSGSSWSGSSWSGSSWSGSSWSSYGFSSNRWSGSSWSGSSWSGSSWSGSSWSGSSWSGSSWSGSSWSDAEWS